MSVSIADRVVVRLSHAGGDSRGAPSSPAPLPSDPVLAATRDELGIGSWDGVATGHQPIFWHGGILAKALCAAELSRVRGHGWLYLVADHDAVDPCAMPYPARRDPHAVRCVTAHFGLPAEAGVAAAAIPSSPVRPPDRACPAPAASPDVAARLDRVAKALAAADASVGAAWRTASANFAALHAAGALEPPSHMIRASCLLRTSLGRDCIARIAADPESCARAFNGALAHAPRAASRLRIDGDTSEVPLWEVDGHGMRLRITGQRLRALLRDGAIDGPKGPCVLLPRAFLATGIVRALGVEFVHGTGGDAYERAGDAWWRSALGRALPPFSVATADLRFTPESFGVRTAEAQHGLTWREAWVDPIRLDGASRDPVREQALSSIAALPRRSAARRQAFAALRSHIEMLRAQHRDRLHALAVEDEARRGSRASVAAATDRTYPAALHDADALAGLSARVAESVSASAASSGASGSRR